MSYGQRIATYEQFMKILENSAESRVRHAPSADQISGLMEGVTVSLRLEEMSVDYAEIIEADKMGIYTPRHRVHATILFDYSTYVVDVMDEDWFDLPSIDQWQASLPVITIPAKLYEEIVNEEAAPEPNEALRKAARKARKAQQVAQRPGDEDGGAVGARVPAPAPTPAGDVKKDLPSETPVG